MLRSPEQVRTTTPRATASRTILAAVAMAAISLPHGVAAGGVVKIPFLASNFPDDPVSTNPLYPLIPGTVTIFKAEGADGCEEVHITVTTETREVAGVTTVVVRDLAYEDPECDGEALILVERTDDWFAEDEDGNVWYFGEATEDCEGEGSCEPGPGAWEAGVAGAEAGIIMLDAPKSGDQYYQEFAPGIAEDQAKVTGVDTTVSLKRDDAYTQDDLTGCLKTKEWTRLDPGHVEQKYYCPGVGLVAVDEHHGKRLRFELVDPSPDRSPDPFDFRTVPGAS